MRILINISVRRYDGAAITAVNAIAFVPICAFILHRPWVSSNSGTTSGCSLRAAHTASSSYVDGNSFSLFNLKTVIGWAVRAIFHGFFLSLMALWVLAPATFASSSVTGDGGAPAPKDVTAVGTFILYAILFLHLKFFRSISASISLPDFVFFRYSVIQFYVLLSDCYTSLTAPHALVIVAYLILVFAMYLVVASVNLPALSYYQATFAVLSQPLCWLLFLLGFVVVSSYIKICLSPTERLLCPCLTCPIATVPFLQCTMLSQCYHIRAQMRPRSHLVCLRSPLSHGPVLFCSPAFSTSPGKRRHCFSMFV